MAVPKRYKGSSWVVTDELPIGARGARGSTGSTGSPGSTGAAGIDSAEYAMMLATTTFKAQTFDPWVPNLYFSSLTDSRLYFQAIELPVAATLTGIILAFSAQGVFTADNNNKVGLYTNNGTTLTRVAQSTNDGNIWKVATNSSAKTAFTSTYAAAAGSYWLAYLYNSSAQTTAPALPGKFPGSNGVGSALLAATDISVMNGRFPGGYLDGQTDLPSTTAVSGLTFSSTVLFGALY